MPDADDRVAKLIADARWDEAVAICEAVRDEEPGLLASEVRCLLRLGRATDAVSRVQGALAGPHGIEKDEFWKRHWMPLLLWARAQLEPPAPIVAELAACLERWRNKSGRDLSWLALAHVVRSSDPERAGGALERAVQSIAFPPALAAAEFGDAPACLAVIERWQRVTDRVEPDGAALNAIARTVELAQPRRAKKRQPARFLGAGTVLLDLPVTRLALAGTRLYAVGGTTVSIIDVAAPQAPRVLGSVELGATCSAVAVRGAVAYVACWGEGLYAIDVEDPAHPVVTRAAPVPYAHSIHHVIAAGRFLVTVDEQALTTWDLADPRRPVTAATIHAWSNARDGWLKYGALAGDHYVGAQGKHGIVAIGVADPSAPAPVAAMSIAVGGEAARVYAVDCLAGTIVAATSAGLALGRISGSGELALSTLVGEVDGLSADDLHMAIHNGLAVVGCGGVHHAIDLSDPRAPVYRGRQATAVDDLDIRHAVVAGDVLIGATEAGLVSRPFEPR